MRKDVTHGDSGEGRGEKGRRRQDSGLDAAVLGRPAEKATGEGESLDKDLELEQEQEGGEETRRKK
ncbi:hypothetical protein ACIQMR_37005 [Streptomyces sp. NPDC091376]|uniref:hypothetical protein n=1 Tax=Streptomyces sp. NPDC091376 TaxID=3365994 RepID=UPI0037F56576